MVNNEPYEAKNEKDFNKHVLDNVALGTYEVRVSIGLNGNGVTNQGQRFVRLSKCLDEKLEEVTILPGSWVNYDSDQLKDLEGDKRSLAEDHAGRIITYINKNHEELEADLHPKNPTRINVSNRITLPSVATCEEELEKMAAHYFPDLHDKDMACRVMLGGRP